MAKRIKSAEEILNDIPANPTDADGRQFLTDVLGWLQDQQAHPDDIAAISALLEEE